MTQQPPPDPQVDPPPAPHEKSHPLRVVVLVCALLTVGLTGTFAGTLAASLALMRYGAGQLLVSRAVLILAGVIVALALVGIAAHVSTWWRRPLRRLIDTLLDIRAGKAPIDELRHTTGGLLPLVPVLDQLLRDLRQKKGEMAQLEEEMRQRIANRTDAMERMIGSLRYQATMDSLTGLHNRRLLDEYLPHVFERCQTEGTALSVVMIDVDNFKLLNDTLGHAAGDHMLKTVGQFIRSSIRPSDIAFRYGGDEFFIVLPETPHKGAQVVAKRLMSLSDELAKTIHLPKPPRLSVGVASLHDLPDPTVPKLLAEADKALYELKQARKKAEQGLQTQEPTLQCPALIK